MINELLVALANKTTGFTNPDLNVHQAFVPVKTTEANVLRRLVTNDEDEWVLCLRQLMKQEPTVSLLLPAETLSSDLTIQPSTQHQITGGKLVANATGPATVMSGSSFTSWPLSSVVKVTYSTDNAVRITYGSTVTVIPVAITADRVSLSWPDAVRINGDLILDAPYNKNTEVTITLPVRYPIEQIIEQVDSTTELFPVLEATNLSHNYFWADCDEEKLAIVGLALYRMFREVNP